MNKEELIGKLQMVYVGDKNALNEMIDYYDELFDEMSDWREEAKELKKQLKKKNKPQIFIETQDMEERCAEGLYQDYLEEENKQLKDKLSKIETLIINHNCDTGDIYYKYNSKFLKSELKQRILEIVYEQGSDSNE